MSKANSAPSGWHPVNRDRARYAMGEPMCFKGTAGGGNNTIAAAGVKDTDLVLGVINLSNATEAQADLTTVIPASNALTLTTGTPWTSGEHYVVIVWRRQEDDRG